MDIRIPPVLVRAWRRFEDWGDVDVWRFGCFTVRRIDLVLAVSFMLCTSWYGYGYGWRGALVGAAGFILVAATSAMMRS